MNIALILSGGTGTRLGESMPKQYIDAGGRMIITYCLETLAGHEEIDAVQIVADPLWQETILKEAALHNVAPGKLFGFSKPGENRQQSIFHGLQDIKEYAGRDDLVLIHDAARPLLSKEQIADCLAAVCEHDGAMPVLPMKDTVYFSNDGQHVSNLLDRSSIFAGQAPEVFRFGSYYEANLRLLPDKILSINGSTEPAILMGLDIVMVPGDERNFKITTQNDLKRFQQIAEAGEERDK